MAEDETGEKTEAASPFRREEARAKGQVAKSREIPAALTLFGGLLIFTFLGQKMLIQVMTLTGGLLSNAGTYSLTPTSVPGLAEGLLAGMGSVLLPLFGMVLFLAVAGNVAQHGFLFSFDPILPHFDKINPIAGLRRLFSAQALFELPKSVGKIAVIALATYLAVRKNMEGVFFLTQMEPLGILFFLFRVIYQIMVNSVIALLGLAVADYAFQRVQYEKRIRQSPQELKEEMKRREGDPAIKARRRVLARELVRRRMMAAVPKAEVVITNPTHYAVALDYNEGMIAPKVAAKGMNLLAERIKELAREHRVPIVEDAPLAQALYKTAAVDTFVPVELYQAVAEVLAYVYKLRGRVSV